MTTLSTEDRVVRLERITTALQGNHLRVAFQPIFDLTTGQVLGVEALARFDMEPQRTPDRWFEEAGELGLGVDLELLAARRALSFAHLVPPGAFLSLNVSPRTVCSQAFLELCSESFPAPIVVEVAQPLAGQCREDLVAALPRLRAGGLRLAIEGVQRNEDHLAGLLSLAPEFVKIDMGLCQYIHLDPERRWRVRSIVARCAGPGAKVVAVGIQARGEVRVLRDIGVRVGQGFFLGLPGRLPLSESAVDVAGLL